MDPELSSQACGASVPSISVISSLPQTSEEAVQTIATTMHINCEVVKSPDDSNGKDFTSTPSTSFVEEPPKKVAKPLSQHSKDKFASKGMAFLLQQMRSSASVAKSIAPTPSSRTTDDKSAVQGHRFPENINSPTTGSDENLSELTIPKLESPIVYTFANNFPLTLDDGDKCENRVDAPITINVEPFEVIRDCFRSKTTPNFCFSEKIAENNYVRSCKWRPDGLVLLADSEDRRVRVFRFEDDKQLKLMTTMRSGDLIYDVQWHPRRDLFATTSRENPIHLWNSEGHLKLSFRGINHLDELASAYSLGFSLDGSTLYAGYYKMLRIFNLERPGCQIRDLKTFEKGSFTSGQKAILSCIATCPTMNGVYAVGCYGDTVGLYSDHTGACDCLFQTQSVGITHLQYSSDGNLLFAGCRKSSLIECFDLRFPVKVLSTFYRPADTNQRFHFQLDRFDRNLFSGSSTGSILIYDLKSGNCQSTEAPNGGANPSWIVPSSKAAVTGLSIHPTAPIVAATSGQCVYPRPSIARNLSNSSSGESSTEEDSKDEVVERWDSRSPIWRYTKHATSDSLDNSLKLWRI